MKQERDLRWPERERPQQARSCMPAAANQPRAHRKALPTPPSATRRRQIIDVSDAGSLDDKGGLWRLGRARERSALRGRVSGAREARRRPRSSHWLAASLAPLRPCAPSSATPHRESRPRHEARGPMKLAPVCQGPHDAPRSLSAGMMGWRQPGRPGRVWTKREPPTQRVVCPLACWATSF